MSARTRNDTREARRVEGDKRNAEWAALTPAEKLASLDRRLGKGVGARRQREKLA